jgi:hypothetical protein
VEAASSNITTLKSGEYRGKESSLKIKADLSFEYQNFNEKGNMCIVEGTFLKKDGYFEFKDSDCTVKIIIKNKDAIEIDGSCNYGICGMGVDIDHEELRYKN